MIDEQIRRLERETLEHVLRTAVFFRHQEDGRMAHVVIEGDRAQVAVKFPINAEMTFQNGADFWPVVITDVGDVPEPEDDFDD